MKIILIGPPGAGKGTVAGDVASYGCCRHLSTGDLFREHLRRGTALGEEARTYIDKGQLVADELTVRMVEDSLHLPDGHLADFVLDGFPRTVPQAEALDELLERSGDELDVAILLELPDEEVLHRLTTRLVCRDCGRIYNAVAFPPKVEGVCDDCGGEVGRRSDDEPATIAQRMESYEKQTRPLIDYYESRGKLLHIDASHSSAETWNQIREQLDVLIARNEARR